MEISRDIYLNALISMKHTSFIKIVTGIRRCGKSYLLFKLFYDYLKQQNIDDTHIVMVDLDSYENRGLRNPDALYEYLQSRLSDNDMHYILLDEIQLVDDFEGVLNGFLRKPNTDIYVTGSNARLLSKDVITEFRGRGYEIKVHPLSFREFMSVYNGTPQRGLDEFMTYGGLPQVLEYPSEQQKAQFLKSLFTETYIRDIKERYAIRDDGDLEELISMMASNIGCLTNPHKLSNTFHSEKQSAMSSMTIKTYLDYLCDAFLIDKATRYDIKGKRYIDTPYKYYFEDLGLRNARLNFRQNERTHLMENIIYNDLRIRGFNVDVGVVPVRGLNAEGKQQRSQLEIDFVCNMGSRRYYVQSAYSLPTEEKIKQEEASLLKVNDFFKRIIITGDDVLVHRNDAGITIISIYDFLLKENSLDL